jgi:hypothetical protein
MGAYAERLSRLPMEAFGLDPQDRRHLQAPLELASDCIAVQPGPLNRRIRAHLTKDGTTATHSTQAALALMYDLEHWDDSESAGFVRLA